MSSLRAIRPSSACPCSSGNVYRDCCGPLHAGRREAETAAELMRSRYSAFATGAIDYLIRTLHPDHPDTELPRDVLAATLSNTCRSYRYTGLTVEEHVPASDSATVTFLAKVFDHGIDRSFRERSTFWRTTDGWRYLSGETLPLR